MIRTPSSCQHLIVVGAITGLLLTLSACASVELGHDFDLRAIETKIIPGQSSRDDVRAWAGDPVSTGIAVNASGTRSEKWSYYYGHGKLPGLKDAHMKILEIEFDDQGRVRSYNWSQ
jgi:hypothetical protein